MPTTTPTIWLAPFKINSTDAGPGGDDQTAPQVIALTGGRFFVAWSDNGNATGLGAPDIYGRFVDPAGAFNGGPLGGSDFILNSFQDFTQGPPAIATRPDGGFTLVYQTTTDQIFNLGEGVPVDLFDTNGLPLGNPNPGPSWINSAADETAPVIAAFADGSSVVVYEDNNGFDTDLHFHMVSAAGLIGPELDVVSGPGYQYDAQAAALGASSFVTAYVTNTAPTQDIAFAIRQTDGTFVAGGTVASGGAEQTDPSIAVLTGGGFAVTWTDSASDGSGTAVRARLYTSAGAPLPALPGSFAVNTSAAGDQKTPSIAALADGGFVIVWDDDGAQEIRGQRFSAAGALIGAQFTVAAMSNLSGPDVALLDDGRFVVSFANEAGGNSDVYTAIFDPRDTLINATAGNDVFTSRIDGATVNGLGGNDTLLGQAGADFLYGGADNDTLSGGLGNDRIDGGSGIDTVDYGAAASALYIDLRVATQAGTGGLGTDVISTIENVIGGAFADILVGNAGANALSGGAGNDYLAGREGDDALDGGAGADTAEGGAGLDTLRGGAGDDFLLGGADSDTIYGGDGRTNISDIGDRWLGGDGGDDFIFGNLGTDRLSGGAGNDTLTGGEGFDYMTGEAGIDTFVYNAVSDGSASEQIGDWQGGIDRLRIDASAFGGGLAAGPLAADRLVMGSVATQAFGQFLYNSVTGVLAWDADGTGAGGVAGFTRLLTSAFTLPPAVIAVTDFDIVV